MSHDLVIVGAGPAGLATALFAKRAGFEPLILEHRGEQPMDKACGEGIMPPGVALLRSLGVELDASCPFVGIRYLDGDLTAEGHFSSPGLGVRRTTLSAGLRRCAEAAGIEVLHEARYLSHEVQGDQVRVRSSRGLHEGRLLVGADGLHSRVRVHAGLAGPRSAAPRRYGLRRHYHIEPWSEFVEVHWHPALEAYVTPVGAELVGVAFLWGGGAQVVHNPLRHFPSLQRRLAEAMPASRWRGAGPFRQMVRGRVGDGVALVGDAAGYVDALTGEGITLALSSAAALVRALQNRDLGSYEHEYRRLSRAYVVLTRLLLQIGARPWARRRLVRALAARPKDFDRMLAILCHELPLGQFARTASTLVWQAARL